MSEKGGNIILIIIPSISFQAYHSLKKKSRSYST